MKVLYVEDNVADADLVRRYLSQIAGYTLDIAPNLRQAIARLQGSHDVDVVLSDLGLPVL